MIVGVSNILAALETSYYIGLPLKFPGAPVLWTHVLRTPGAGSLVKSELARCPQTNCPYDGQVSMRIRSVKDMVPSAATSI